MSDSRTSDVTAIVILVAAVLMLLVGGGAAFILSKWKSQTALVEQERALAAQAKVVAEQRLLEARAASVELEDTNGDFQAIENAIRTVLQTQQRAWNSGDIDQFMKFYWQSEDLTFSSGGTLTRTWQGTLDNYKQRYPSQDEMGQLSFQDLEITPLGKTAAFVLGEWHLSRQSQDLGGNFTLIFRRLADTWVIVHDHTSRAQQR